MPGLLLPGPRYQFTQSSCLIQLDGIEGLASLAVPLPSIHPSAGQLGFRATCERGSFGPHGCPVTSTFTGIVAGPGWPRGWSMLELESWKYRGRYVSINGGSPKKVGL